MLFKTELNTESAKEKKLSENNYYEDAKSWRKPQTTI